MKNIITAIIVVVGAAGGSFAGGFLKSSGSSTEPAKAETATEKDDGHGEKKDDHGKKKDDHGDSHGGKKGKKDAKSSGDTSYFDFSREFVIPILDDGQVSALVIININLEVDSSLSGKLFRMEPKLRDNIMTSLIGLTNDKRVFSDLTSVRNYETIRSVVLSNLRDEISSDIMNVLIVDIAKQDI